MDGIKKIHSGLRFLPMLLMQVIFYVFVPLAPGTAGGIILNLLYYASMVLGLYGARVGKKQFIFGSAVASFCFVFTALVSGPDTAWWEIFFLSIHIILETSVIVAILYYIARATRADLDMIFGAVGVYFLVGTLWATLYIQVEKLMPHSFHIPAEIAEATKGLPYNRLTTFMYYSFITLTTLGYGDIVPVNPIARNLAVMEALFGQVYTAVLVARLVGLHLFQATQDKND